MSQAGPGAVRCRVHRGLAHPCAVADDPPGRWRVTRRQMLCSGTGGPCKTGMRALACPVCGKADFSGYAATRRVVPRHFVKPGAASPAGRETAAASPATKLDTERITISV
jgi:hypothetical protein